MYTLLWRRIYGPHVFFNFFTFFERILYRSNCIIFIFSWCATHTKIRSKLVVIVTAESQKITLWGPQRTPLGILRVKAYRLLYILAILKLKIPKGDYIAFIYFIWILKQTVTFALYIIKRLVFITEVVSAYCAVRNESLCNTDNFRPKRVNFM